jgi:hypothetical protein
MKKLFVITSVSMAILLTSNAAAETKCDIALKACGVYVGELNTVQKALRDENTKLKEQRDGALKQAAKGSGSDWLLYFLGGVAVGALGAAALK